MRRRAYLAGTGSALAAGAGCLADESDDSTVPGTVADPPQGVYRPVAASTMAVVGVADAGPFRLALAYGRPVRFWEVVGEETYLRDVEPADDVHLVALAFDPESGVVFPEVGLTVEVERDGALVAHEAVYAMLSQGLGFHYGDNVALDGDGRYAVTVAVGGLQLRRTGAFAGRFGEPASHTFRFDYAREERDALAFVRADDPGSRGALPAASLDGAPAAVAPAQDAPGAVRGRATSADVGFEVRALAGDAAASRVATRRDAANADAGGEDPASDADDYLAVLAHTPYRRLVVPAMGLRVVVERDGDADAPRILDRTVDPALGYHYGAPVAALDDATAVRVETLTPPQVARHPGYETAFLDVDPVRVPLG